MFVKTISIAAVVATSVLSMPAFAANTTYSYDVTDEVTKGKCEDGYALKNIADFSKAVQVKLNAIDTHVTNGVICIRDHVAAAAETPPSLGNGLAGAGTGFALAAAGTLLVLTLNNNANNTTSTVVIK